MTADMSLYRGFLPEIRNQVIQHRAIEHPAGHILRPGEFAPLYQQDLEAFLRYAIGGSTPGWSRPYYYSVKSLVHGFLSIIAF